MAQHIGGKAEQSMVQKAGQAHEAESGKGARPSSGQGWVCPGVVYGTQRAGILNVRQSISKRWNLHAEPGETRQTGWGRKVGRACLRG